MMRSIPRNIYNMNPLEEKEETWEERFQRLKDEGKLIPLGNGRWIEADKYTEAMKQASEKFKDITFMGEFEHPEQIPMEV